MADQYEKYKLPKRWGLKDYTNMMESLLPEGVIWFFDRFLLGKVIQDVISGVEWQDTYDSPQVVQDVIEEGLAEGHVLRRILSCFAGELERVEVDAWNLVNQTDPGVAEELLPDWERVLGLPEACYQDVELTVEERQIQAHLKLFQRNQTPTAQYLEDYAESLGFDITVVEIPSGTAPRIMGVARMGVERMGGRGGFSIVEITINSGTGDNEFIKCVINQMKPAHVIITWVEP
jgi:uncharacterized protein YmfQ (DUF2313 family)